MDGYKCEKCSGIIPWYSALKIRNNCYYHEECYNDEEEDTMNWLDKVISEGQSKYYVSKDGSFWVDWTGETVRLAIGEGDPTELKEITDNEFIASLLVGKNIKGAWD